MPKKGCRKHKTLGRKIFLKFETNFAENKNMRFFFAFCLLLPACMVQPQEGQLIVRASTGAVSGSSRRERDSGSYRSRGSSSRRSSSSSSSRSGFSFLSTNPNLSVEDYLDTAVYIYKLVGVCDSASSETTHKNCVLGDPDVETDLGCLDPDTYNTVTAVNACIDTCDTANTCITTGYHGSGVFQTSSSVLTNHHVIREVIGAYTVAGKHRYNMLTIAENHSGNREVLSSVAWYDDEDDIALGVLVRALPNTKVPDHGSLDSLKLLDELWTIGSPNGIKWTSSKGHLTNKNPSRPLEYDGYRCNACITFDIPIGGGNSGGPVFNNQGELVGLVAFSSITHNNLNGGPHIDRIKHLLSQNGSGDLSATSRRARGVTSSLSRRERDERGLKWSKNWFWS